MDNYCRGRRRHIWFSVSTDLIMDAKRYGIVAVLVVAVLVVAVLVVAVSTHSPQ